jgi:hypothetical protein
MEKREQDLLFKDIDMAMAAIAQAAQEAYLNAQKP